MDLTEMDFPEQLWILVHDDDERTRELASDVWDENGLDVPTTFLPRLLPYLGRLMLPSHGGHTTDSLWQTTLRKLCEVEHPKRLLRLSSSTATRWTQRCKPSPTPTWQR